MVSGPAGRGVGALRCGQHRVSPLFSQEAELGQLVGVIAGPMVAQAWGDEQEQQALQGPYRALMTVAQPHDHLPDVQGKEGQGSSLYAPPVLNILHDELHVSQQGCWSIL